MLIMRLAILLSVLLVSSASALDLEHAVVVAPGLSPTEEKSVELLLDEVRKRTRIQWRRSDQGDPAIEVRNAGTGAPEGYDLRVAGGRVTIAGNDSRGVLFGIGRLLRELHMERDRVSIPDKLEINTAPKYTLRGHQLGFRPKTNSYDGWTLEIWEQYIRDLAVFGVNAVELIPPRSDDADDSPHFPLSKIETMIGVSRICDSYGIDVWIWYPALDKDYTDPSTVEFALEEWGEVFRQLPRIDAIMVPGGDPGHTHPQHLMPLLEKQAASLRKHHPNAEIWIAPQGFSEEWMEHFYGQIREEPEWLNGIVFGPWIRVSLPQLRADVPQRYPIRHYPDITHSLSSQYPVPDWDLAYALTEHREPINPRPLDMAAIFRQLQPYTIGFITYSEGCNDDVNKAVWSALGWDPEQDVTAILREYSRYFLGPRYEDTFAQGLLALERNWRGPLLTNHSVETTLQQFRSMEQDATPQDLLNWRFQQGLYRAYYDAYNRARLIYETGLEEQAMATLREAPRLGSNIAMEEAEAVMKQAATAPVSQDLRTRVFELAEALYQSIRMQLSVDRYQAISVGRGANLDLIDTPLNNAGWIRDRFEAIRQPATEEERLAALEKIVNWTNPGPGGFYDDLGNLTQQPHLIRGPGYPTDPAHLETSLVWFGGGQRSPPSSRMSWMRYAAVLNDATLRMRYADLDPKGSYSIRITYVGDDTPQGISLVADEKWEVHPARRKDRPIRPVEFPIPREATSDGALNLEWQKEPGDGGPGRGLEIAEVWLIRKR